MASPPITTRRRWWGWRRPWPRGTACSAAASTPRARTPATPAPTTRASPSGGIPGAPTPRRTVKFAGSAQALGRLQGSRIPIGTKREFSSPEVEQGPIGKLSSRRTRSYNNPEGANKIHIDLYDPPSLTPAKLLGRLTDSAPTVRVSGSAAPPPERWSCCRRGCHGKLVDGCILDFHRHQPLQGLRDVRLTPPGGNSPGRVCH